MDPSTYKHLKEEFVSNLSGTSMQEISALSFLFPAFLLLCKWRHLLLNSVPKHINGTRTRDMPKRNRITRPWSSSLCGLIVDFILVVIPTLSIMTIFHAKVYLLTGLTLCAVVFLFLVASKWSRGYNTPIDDKKLAESPQLQFISSYRYVVMLVTCLCILAVDFKIFPRRYAKTETYGTGLMDVGVGSFVVVNALVSRKARGLSARNKGAGVLRSTGPMLALGFARLCFTRGVDYQVHVGEYGVHWNFFFTLAAVALMTSMIHIPVQYSGLLGAFILLAYQLILINGLNSYLHSNQRGASLIDQNKEGIFSLFGYWGLYLLGVQLGHLIFKSGRFRRKSPSWQGMGEIWILAALFWILALVSDSFLERASRRTCNLTYVLFTLAVNLEGLGVLGLSELAPDTEQLLLEEIFTGNMLATFLVANVLTGMVNLTVKTIFAPASTAYAILVLYALTLVAVMGLMNILNLKFKL